MESESIQRAADELEILRLLAKVSQAADDRDEDAYRACFADTVLEPSRVPGEEGQWRQVPSQDYARRAVETVRDLDWTHHRIGNCYVTLDGDHASAKADVVVDMEAVDATGKRERLTIGGRHELEFARSPEGWRMTMRSLVRRYTIGDPTLIARAQALRRPNP